MKHRTLTLVVMSSILALAITTADANDKKKSNLTPAGYGTPLVEAGEAGAPLLIPIAIVGHAVNIVTYPIHALFSSHDHGHY
jgi:hypothetical protein